MENDKSLTSSRNSTTLKPPDNPEAVAETRPQEDPKHSRTWNMPAGWVVPGIEHPDDVARYDPADDWRLYEADGRKRPETDDEFVTLFTRATHLAAVAMSSTEESPNEASQVEQASDQLPNALWEVSLSGSPAVVFHVSSRSEAMALALEIAELSGERDVQVVGPAPNATLGEQFDL